MENLMPHTSALKMPESYIDGQATTIQKKTAKGKQLKWNFMLLWYDKKLSTIKKFESECWAYMNI